MRHKLKKLALVFFGFLIAFSTNHILSANAVDQDDYHDKINDLFNEKVTTLKDLLEDDGFFENETLKAQFIMPKDIDPLNDDLESILKKCPEDNVSSYCLSMQATDEYLKYVKTLQEEAKRLDLLEGGDEVNEQVRYLSDKATEINEEIENSRTVLENAIHIYDEFSKAYPMHISYLQTIEQLEEYQDRLEDLRNEVREFPQRFINSTSYQCR
jgi:hypothetical protein